MKVLIIDDEPAECERLRSVLEPLGHRLASAATGGEGFELALFELPDLVILDGDLPDLRGLDVLCRIRSHSATRNLVVVLAETDPEAPVENMFRAHALNVDAYWFRPVEAFGVLRLLKLLG